jgi:FKBP-type peptidyl-prolyl cis-trans isomerase
MSALSKKDLRKLRKDDGVQREAQESTETLAGKKRQLSEVDPELEEVNSQLVGLDDHSKRIIMVRYLMNLRDKARSESDFARSDSLRMKLSKMGVEVKDQKNGPSGWKFNDGSTTKLDQGVHVPEFATRKKLKASLPESVSTHQKTQQTKSKDVMEAERDRNKSTLEKIQGNKSSAGTNIQGVQVEELEVGTGALAEQGKKVRVFYVGKLKSTGKVFDASTKTPFSFKLGKGEVIRGWDIGVSGMRVGGRRRLTIPPEKAYGKSGAPPAIPGNATLIFDVQLVGV